jgi:integrase
LRTNSYRSEERYLLEHFQQLHAIPLTRIDRRTVAARLSEIATSSGPSAADRARASLSAFLSWTAKEGLVETNPVAFTNTHRVRKARDRVLSQAELVEVWRAAGDDAYGTIVKLLILTGQRREEIGALPWHEIDFPARLIRLSGERTKNHRPHDVPLSEPAVALLQAMPRIGAFVFGGTASHGFSSFTEGKAKLDQRLAAAHQEEPMRPWVLHDVRRSVATHMAETGIAQPHVIEAVLNHSSGHKAGVAGVYNRASYDKEKRAALDRWADHVLAAVEGRDNNVVPLRA